MNVSPFFVTVIFSVWGGAIGAAAGIWLPLLLANILGWLMGDKTDIGIGFFLFLTVPILAYYGIRYAAKVVPGFIASGQSLSYFAQGLGLWQAAPFFALGSIGVLFVIYVFIK